MSSDRGEYAERRTYETDDELRQGRNGPTKVDNGEGLWRFWDEGLVTFLIVGGAILFVFPEPITSSVGILMMGFGVLMWLVDWLT